MLLMKTRYIIILLLTALIFPMSMEAQKKKGATRKKTNTAVQQGIKIDPNLSADELWDKFREAVEAGRHKEAVTYVRHAADKGHKYACYILGISYYFETSKKTSFTTNSIKDDKDIVFKYKAGDFGIQQPDYDKAICYLKTSADNGYSSAYGVISLCYEAKKDEKTAFDWAKKGVDKGDVDAMRLYGDDLLYGTGCVANPAEGIKWLRTAVEKGDKSSTFLLGLYYHISDEYAKAAYWLHRFLSHEPGHYETCYRLAYLYCYGDGVPKDRDKSFIYIKTAYEKCDDISFSYHCLYFLAVHYENGWGVAKSTDEARRLFTKVFEQTDDTDLKTKAMKHLNSLEK